MRAARAMKWLRRKCLVGAREIGRCEYCEEGTVVAMLKDVDQQSARPVSTNRIQCLANIAGCVVLALPTPAFADYDRRALDFAAHLRLTATLLWLHDHPESAAAERFERRPEPLRSARHASGVDASRGMVYVDNFYTGREARFELPLSPK